MFKPSSQNEIAMLRWEGENIKVGSLVGWPIFSPAYKTLQERQKKKNYTSSEHTSPAVKHGGEALML